MGRIKGRKRSRWFLFAAPSRAAEGESSCCGPPGRVQRSELSDKSSFSGRPITNGQVDVSFCCPRALFFFVGPWALLASLLTRR
jgi:hypothetical protein